MSTVLDELTPRSREVYEFIVRKIKTQGFPPSVREIGDEFGIKSPNAVMCHLKMLQQKGLIHRDQRISPAIRFQDASSSDRVFPGYTHLSLEISDSLGRELLALTDGRDEGIEDVLRKAIGLYKASAAAHREGKAVGITVSPETLETQFVDF